MIRVRALVGALSLLALSSLAFGEGATPRRWTVSPLQAATLEGLYAKGRLLEGELEAERKKVKALEGELEATRGHMETAVAAIRSELSIPDVPLRTVQGSGWSELEEAPAPPPEPPASIKRPAPNGP